MSILEKYNSEYRGMVENICGIVLTNIIGHVAIKKPFNDTGFLYEEYLQISKVFAGKPGHHAGRALLPAGQG